MARPRKKTDGPARVVPLRPRPALADMRPERFEFVDAHRGPMARLAWGAMEVVCTEWPQSLLAMLSANVLGPDARGEAESIRAALETA